MALPKQRMVKNEFGKRRLGREQATNGTKSVERQATLQAANQGMKGSMRNTGMRRRVRAGG